MSVSVSTAGSLALPVILWQTWRFVVPGLHKKEKQYALPFVFSSIVLFLLGGFIAYWTLDKALQFLISFSGADIRQAFQISQYVRFVGIMIAAFGVGMEFPVLLVFLGSRSGCSSTRCCLLGGTRSSGSSLWPRSSRRAAIRSASLLSPCR
ncbi:MAG: twin-arginine translocase subunit TatC [Ilumatobacteraceae bacterium]